MTPRIGIRLLVLGSALATASARAAFGSELLRLDFNDSAHLGIQSGDLLPGIVSGDVKPSRTFPGSVEFGPAGGLIRVPAFHSPQGPFTVEARFLVHSYGKEDGRFISDIMSTATWDNGPSQGFELKVGGGYLYPPLPRDAYGTEAEWVAAQGAYSHIDRGRLSDCFTAFFMARKDDPRDWKAVYTDRCIERNAWTHLVGVWDGSRMRIFLNGTEATDKWRVQGQGAEQSIDSVADAYIGSGYNVEINHTNLDGIIDYVKVEDRALSENEIHSRYRNSAGDQNRDSTCRGMVVPRAPAAGRFCKGKLDLEFEIISDGGCTDPAFLAGYLAGDSIEIEIAKDPSFDHVELRAVATKALHLEAPDIPSLVGYVGVIYWRVRVLHANQGLAKRSAAPEAWSLSRPLVLDLADASAIRRSGKSLRPVLMQAGTGLFVAGNDGSATPVLYNPAGERQPVRFQRVAGGWRMDVDGNRLSGLFFVAK